MDDIISDRTAAPAAIILDLGLGNESGFAVLRKCHSEPKLNKVPILVWQNILTVGGADDFLVKSDDKHELRESLTKLLGVPQAA